MSDETVPDARSFDTALNGLGLSGLLRPDEVSAARAAWERAWSDTGIHPRPFLMLRYEWKVNHPALRAELLRRTLAEGRLEGGIPDAYVDEFRTAIANAERLR